MSVPSFQNLLRPVLSLLSDKADHSLRGIREGIAQQLQLGPEDLADTLKSGTGVFVNRISWALVHLKKANAVSSVQTGVYRITEKGLGLLAQNPGQLTLGSLGAYAEPGPEPQLTPEEQLEASFQTLQSELADELLAKVKSMSPSAFERLVVDLLHAIGYGATLEDAGTVTGQSGDGGIDGTIKQDKLGLDMVYLQAKRWQSSVGSPDVMQFCGGLTAHHAHKGVMLTTSQFTADAHAYVKKIPQKIVLIGGRQLAALMIDHNVGVSLKTRVSLKRLNEDYFEDL